MRIPRELPPPTWAGDDSTAASVAAAVESAQRQGVKVAVDTETTGLDISRAEVLFWSICFETGSRYCLPASQLPRFALLFADPQNRWLFTNAKFDRHMLANTGVTLAGQSYCTFVADWLFNGATGGHGLKECMNRYFDIPLPSFKATFGIRSEADVPTALPLYISGGDPEKFQKAVNYASSDAWATFKLGNYLEDQLRKVGDWHFMEEIYVPLTSVLYEMERAGILIDKAYLQELNIQFEQRLRDCEIAFSTTTGRVGIKLTSMPELRRFFFEEEGRKPIKWTSGGKSGNRQPSLDASVLEQWANGGDTAATVLLDYRALGKLKSTYVIGLAASLDADNRVHTTFHSHHTATGRLSSSDPALQNIPVRKEEGAKIRGAFIAPPGKTLLCFDYAQLEQCIMAHFSEDENMRRIIREGKDIHSGTVEIMWPEITYSMIVQATAAKKEKKVLSPEYKLALERRREVKSLSFGLNYEMGEESLARELGVSESEAAEKKSKYLSQFPGLQRYIQKQHAFAYEELKVYTILGRHRPLWGVLGVKDTLAQAQRCSVNTPIQGTAADIVMLAMLRLSRSQELKDLGIKMLLQVHDELIFESPSESVEAAVPIIKKLMEVDEVGLSVPLRADYGVGRNWLEAKG